MARFGDVLAVKVLVSGYYGFGNAGDEALLAGLLAGLRDKGHAPLVLSTRPRATSKLHGVDSVRRVSGILPGLLRCDALISGGGGLLQDSSSRRSLSYYLSVIRLATALGKRVVVYGQSVGPLSAAGKRAVTRALQGVSAAVRDKPSRKLLLELGITAELVADPALLLEPPEPTRRNGPLVLIPRSGYPQLGDALASLGKHIRAMDEPVEVVAMHAGEDDGEALRLVAALPGATLRVTSDHRDALKIITGARAVVSARLHGLILATVSRTPWVGLVYDPKVTGFVNQSGGIAFAPPVDPSSLIAAVEDLRAPSPQARQLLRSLARDGMDWLDQALRGTVEDAVPPSHESGGG